MSFPRLKFAVYCRALSVTAWKQSGKNTLPVPWAALFTKPISSQRYALTPLDPWKSTSHWSEKLAVSHYAQTPNALAFSVLPNNHLPLCLFAINDWISVTPPLWKKRKQTHFCSVYVSPTHTAAACTRQHAQQSLSPAFRWGPMETVLIISLLLQSTAVCFGIRGFLWRLHMHIHWLQAREREAERGGGGERERVLLLNNPPHHSLLCQPIPSPSSRPKPDTLASPGSITSPWCNV